MTSTTTAILGAFPDTTRSSRAAPPARAAGAPSAAFRAAQTAAYFAAGVATLSLTEHASAQHWRASPQPLVGPTFLAAPGYELVESAPLPAFATFTVLADGARIVFDGLDVWRYTGPYRQRLAHLSAFVFPSFLVAAPGEQFVLFGESTSDQVWRVGSHGGGLTFVAAIPNNFEAVFLDGHHVLVSAAQCGFNCGNDLVRIDLQTSAVSLVGHVTGPSGPLALLRDGTLLYADQSPAFPTPPGSTNLLAWSAQQLASGVFLTEGNAQILVAGLDGVSDLVVDPFSGEIFAAEPHFLETSAILRFGPSFEYRGAIASGSRWISNLVLRPLSADAPFQPWQPRAFELYAQGSDFSSGSGDLIERLVPDRATLACTHSGASIELEVRGAPRLGWIQIFSAPATAWQPPEHALVFAGATFVTAAPLASWHALASLQPTDAFGRASLRVPSSGGRVFQALLFDHQGRAVASTTAAFE